MRFLPTLRRPAKVSHTRFGSAFTLDKTDGNAAEDFFVLTI